MKRYRAILLLSILALELILTIVHQLFMGVPYHYSFFAVPIFFIFSELTFCSLLKISCKRNRTGGEITQQWSIVVYKFVKLFLSAIVIGIFAYINAAFSLELILRFFVAYLVFTLIETWVAMDYLKYLASKDI